MLAVPTDVSGRAGVETLKEKVYDLFGAVDFLMNNAGRGGPGATLFGDPERWKGILDTNLWGVIHGVQVFAPPMIAQKTPARDCQHRIEARDHLPARRHRLQCLEGRREGGDGRPCPRASQHRRLPGRRHIS